MINWSEASPVLQQLFSELAFEALTPPFRAHWGARSQTMTHPQAQADVLLRIRRIDPVGEDETRYVEETPEPTPENPDPESQLIPYQMGNRRITLEVRVESHQQTDEMWAWSTIERMRTRLSRPSSLQKLLGINMALVRTQGAVPLPMVRDKRHISVAVMEVVLSARFADADVPVDWIEHIEITSKLKDADDSELPSPPNGTAMVPPLPEEP